MVVLAVMRVARLFIVGAVLASLGSSSGSARQASGTPQVIEVTAERFEFWPAEIAIGHGENVELHVRSEDTVHGFRIVGTSTNLIVPKRGKGRVIAKLGDLPVGKYTFECSRMCGAGHNFMRGTLTVRESSGASR